MGCLRAAPGRGNGPAEIGGKLRLYGKTTPEAVQKSGLRGFHAVDIPFYAPGTAAGAARGLGRPPGPFCRAAALAPPAHCLLRYISTIASSR